MQAGIRIPELLCAFAVRPEPHTDLDVAPRERHWEQVQESRRLRFRPSEFSPIRTALNARVGFHLPSVAIWSLRRVVINSSLSAIHTFWEAGSISTYVDSSPDGQHLFIFDVHLRGSALGRSRRACVDSTHSSRSGGM